MNKNETPMFVAFGFDDNGIPESLLWASNLFKKYGSASFFLSSHFIKNKGIRDEWNKLMLNGHEVGNHTHNHNYGGDFSESQWFDEIKKCNDILTSPYPEGPGVNINKIYGFRSPYLGCNKNTFKVIRDLGFLYDCSTEEGWESEYNGANFKWPQKENNLWLMPCYPVIIPPDNKCREYGVPPGFRETKVGIGPNDEPFDKEDGKITGLDYNMLISYKMNKAEFLATLKYTFDIRLNGNRCPMLFGAHSDFYHDSFDLAENITPKEMREAIEEFLEYISSKENVVITSYKNIIDYLNKKK